jgi:repressor LexA
MAKAKPKLKQKPLTPLQRTALDIIARYHRIHRCAPTYREIQEQLSVKSKASVAQLVSALEARGAIRRIPFAKRAIEVLEWPEAWAPQSGESEIPLLGTIAAGVPIQAILQQELLTVPSDLRGEGLTYGLRVRGDSMKGDGILDGDFLVIEANQTAQNGEIVVALIDEENATLKRFFRSPEGIRLEPSNEAYRPIYITDPERLRIQGILRGVLRKYPRMGGVDGGN